MAFKRKIRDFHSGYYFVEYTYIYELQDDKGRIFFQSFKSDPEAWGKVVQEINKTFHLQQSLLNQAKKLLSDDSRRS